MTARGLRTCGWLKGGRSIIELFTDLQFMIPYGICVALGALSCHYVSGGTPRGTGGWQIASKTLLSALQGNRSGFRFELSILVETLSSLLSCSRNG